MAGSQTPEILLEIIKATEQFAGNTSEKLLKDDLGKMKFAAFFPGGKPLSDLSANLNTKAVAGAAGVLSKLILGCNDIIGFICQYSFSVCSLPCPTLPIMMRELCVAMFRTNFYKCKNEMLLTCAFFPKLKDIESAGSAIKEFSGHLKAFKKGR